MFTTEEGEGERAVRRTWCDVSAVRETVVLLGEEAFFCVVVKAKLERVNGRASGRREGERA